MPDPTLLGVGALAALLATLAVAGILWFPVRQSDESAPPEADQPRPRSFVFRQGYLVGSSGGTGFLLPAPINHLTAWDELRSALAELLHGADSAMEALAAQGKGFHLRGMMGDDQIHVIGLRDGEETRVTVSVAGTDAEDLRVDLRILDALEAESDLMQQSQDASPALSWVLDREGRVIWGNARYLTEVANALGAEAAASWPLPALFPGGEAMPAGPTRRALSGGRGKPERWFEVSHMTTRGGLRHAHAQPLNRLIEAEANLRTFITTLTRTFTALPTGLAIFDHQRQLVMHNPHFLDMTDLDGAWLTSRPHLVDILDALRERQRIPEPRDWKAWRDAVVEAGDPARHDALQGPWQETWTLPGGQSLRMTVQPQGGGAVAILLEDVSAEVALARRRRADGEVMRAMLDASEDAVVALGADVGVIHMNARMRDVLALTPGDEPEADDVLARLAARLRDAALWPELREMTRGTAPLARRTESVAVGSGDAAGHVTIRVVPLGSGHVSLHLAGDLAAIRPVIGPTDASPPARLHAASA